MKYGAHISTVLNVERHRANFLARKPQLRLYPHYPQSRACYRMSNNPDALNSSYPAKEWDMGLMIINRMRLLCKWIRKKVDLYKSRIDDKLGPYDFSAYCVCVGIITTIILIASGLGFGIGLGLSIHGFSANTAAIAIGNNSTATISSASTVGVSLYSYFLLILLFITFIR